MESPPPAAPARLKHLSLPFPPPPGGRLVLQTKRKPAQHPRCGATGVVLNGVSLAARVFFGGRGGSSTGQQERKRERERQRHYCVLVCQN